MCGRFTLTTPGTELAEVFGLAEVPEIVARYNIAPGTDVPAIGLDATRTRKTLRALRWGLVPAWADDPKIGNRLVLARAETLDSKPAFAGSFRHRRCALPADGFYEWQAQGKTRQPWLVRRRDGRPFALAALYATWRRGDERRTTCAVVTTAANAALQPIHDRMPVVLSPDEADRWLRAGDPGELDPLLAPAPEDLLAAFRVSTRVNRADYDRPDCLEPLA